MQVLQLPRQGIPQTQYPAHQLTRRYGLETTHPEVLLEDPLASELEDFESWSTERMRMDRPPVYRACGAETHQKTQQLILLYLGFMRNIERVGSLPWNALPCPALPFLALSSKESVRLRMQATYISLTLCEDLYSLSKYLGFLKQKDPASHHHMANTISTIIKALVFLNNTNRCAAPAHLGPKFNWLESLKRQLSKEVAKQVKDSHTLQEEGVCGQACCSPMMAAVSTLFCASPTL